MLRFDIVTVFPRMLEAWLSEGVLGRALARDILQVGVHDLRDFSADKHRTVDDVPYGGGPGMVLRAAPFFGAVDAIRTRHGVPDEVILLSPRGRVFCHDEAARLTRSRHVVLLCGRYEGVDERVREHLATDELSIGDYVLSGGELPAAVVVDAAAQLVPGVVGDVRSVEEDSFAQGILDHPHYTRPADIEGHRVPSVLLSGHHGDIRHWRKCQALKRTWELRPDLLEGASLDEDERAILQELRSRVDGKQER